MQVILPDYKLTLKLVHLHFVTEKSKNVQILLDYYLI